METQTFRHRRLIVKADDFGRGMLMDGWRRFVDICLNTDFPPSIGIVGTDFARNRPAQALGRYLHEGLAAEFWNHSFAHRDLTAMSSDDRRKDTLAAQRAIKDALGITPTIYGPPFNNIDQDAFDDVQRTGEFHGFYFADGTNRTTKNISRSYLSSPEVGTQFFRPISYNYFVEVFNRRELPLALVIQIHPAYWSDECFGEFQKVLRLLQHHGYQGLTAEEFLSAQEVLEHHQGALLDPGSLLAASELIYQGTGTDPRVPMIMDAANSEYYFGRLRRGTTRLTQFLVRQGLLAVDDPPGSGVVLDLGTGIGNWALAAAAASPNLTAFALDRNDRLMSYMRAELEKWVAAPRCTYVACLAEQLPFRDGTVSFAICNNALNYMNVEQTLAELVRVLKPGGLAVLGIQNELYPVLDLLRHLQYRDTKGAIDRIHRIFMTLGRRAGVSDGQRFINYWSDAEITTIARYAGLEPALRGLVPPEEYGQLFDVHAIWEHVLNRTTASRQRSDQLHEGRGATARDLDILIEAGATATAWRVLKGRPALSREIHNLPTLARHICQEERNPAGSLLKQFENHGLTVTAGADSEIRTTVPLLAAKNWTELSAYYRQREDTRSGLELLCCSWLAIRSGSQVPTAATAPDPWLGALFDIGSALCRADEEALREPVRHLFDAARNRAAVLDRLAGKRDVPPEWAVQLRQGMDRTVGAARDQWLKAIFP